MFLTTRTYESLEECRHCKGDGWTGFGKYSIQCETCGSQGLVWIERCSI